MKRIFYAITSALLCLSATLNAQTLPGGDLEPIGANACHFASNDDLATQMGGNAKGFSTILQIGTTYGTMEFYNSSCNDGASQSGSWHLSLQWSATAGADAVSLKLSSALTVGHNYKLTFFTKKNTFYPASSLAIGYSTKDTSFGNFITVIADTFTNVWSSHSYTFSPSAANMQYITVRADSTTHTGANIYVDVDAFSIVEVPVGVENIAAPNGIQIFPNPLHSSAMLTVDENVALPYRLELHDMTGRVVMQQQNISRKEVSIGKNDLPNGVYFIKIMDANNSSFSTRLLIQ